MQSKIIAKTWWHNDALKSYYSKLLTSLLHTGEEFGPISKILIENRFHLTLHIVSPTTFFKHYNNRFYLNLELLTVVHETTQPLVQQPKW